MAFGETSESGDRMAVGAARRETDIAAMDSDIGPNGVIGQWRASGKALLSTTEGGTVTLTTLAFSMIEKRVKVTPVVKRYGNVEGKTPADLHFLV